MRWLELRVPPRLIAVAVGLGMWAMSFLEPCFDFPQSHHWATALGGAVAGAAITFTGAATLRAARTTLLPMRPEKTTSLVTTGIFRWTRNPMYLGLVTALVGWAAFLSAAWPLLGPVVFMLYVNRFQIRPEERVLTELFAAEYTKYTRRVRRWLKPALQAEGSRSREAGGMGLGLSIARNIARAPGGDVSIRNRPSGGLEAVLMQPR